MARREKRRENEIDAGSVPGCITSSKTLLVPHALNLSLALSCCHPCLLSGGSYINKNIFATEEETSLLYPCLLSGGL
jgi:hypothetical protein